MKVESIPEDLLRGLRQLIIDGADFQTVICASRTGIPEAYVRPYLVRMQEAGWADHNDHDDTWSFTEEGKSALEWRPPTVRTTPEQSRAGMKYQVFVSSTFTDLRDERERLIWELQKGGKFIPTGMETFPSQNDRGWEIIQSTIDHSDYYVLIVGGKYGSVEGGVSWTEREYEYALSNGVPVLHFVRDPASIVGEKNVEQDPDKRAKLEAFKTKLQSRHLTAQEQWTNADNLVTRVLQALHSALDTDPRPGWVRGGPSQAIFDLENENERLQQRLATVRLEVRARSESDSAPPLVDQVITAVENEQKKAGVLLERYLDGLLTTLEDLRPPLNPPPREDGTRRFPDDALVEALETTQEPLVDYARICNVVAGMGAEDLVSQLVMFLERLCWSESRPFEGFNYQSSWEFFDFLGHECFVMLVAPLLRDHQFDLIASVFNHPFDGRTREGKQIEGFWAFSPYLDLLDQRNRRLPESKQRALIHLDLLKERHSEGPLAAVSPITSFADADMLALLRAELPPDVSPMVSFPSSQIWRGWTTLLVSQRVPGFLARCRSRVFAEKVLPALGLSSIEVLKARIKERGANARLLWRSPRWNLFPDFHGIAETPIAQDP